MSEARTPRFVFQMPTMACAPGPVAADLAPVLRRAMFDLTRRDGVKFSAADWDFLDALEYVGSEHRRRKVGAEVGAPTPIGDPTDTVGSVHWDRDLEVVGLAEAGVILSCTGEAVRRRILRKTLPARKDARGRWMIARANVESLKGA